MPRKRRTALDAEKQRYRDRKRRDKLRRAAVDVVQAAYCISPSNLGDMHSTPARYFLFHRDGKELPVDHIHAKHPSCALPKPTIIGGGGLIKTGYALDLICDDAGGAVIWGVGLNSREEYPAWMRTRTDLLVGVRDVGTDLRWVPCVSCLSPLLDQYASSEPEHEVVVYEAFFDIPCRYPRFKHWGRRSLGRVLKFLASGKTVVSASYHAAYWATLMGRRVAILPERDSPKFHRSPWGWPVHPPLDPDADQHDAVTRIAGDAVEHSGQLETCRRATLKFAKDAERRLGIELRIFREADYL